MGIFWRGLSSRWPASNFGRLLHEVQSREVVSKLRHMGRWAGSAEKSVCELSWSLNIQRLQVWASAHVNLGGRSFLIEMAHLRLAEA